MKRHYGKSEKIKQRPQEARSDLCKKDLLFRIQMILATLWSFSRFFLL